jgi:hypothetical protein
MNYREETSTVISYLRIIEKQKKIIKELKSNFLNEKKKRLKELNKYKIILNKKSNTGVSISSKNKLKQRINKVFQELNKELNTIGFGITGCIKIDENIQNLVSTNFLIQFNQEASSSESNVDISEKSLFFKDKAYITDKSYHLFRKGMNLRERVSTLYSIKKQRIRKGLVMGIRPLDTGYYRDPVKMIKERIARYAKNIADGEGLDLIRIKLGCDGTNVSRNVKLVNFVFGIINEKLKAASVSGCYRIGIFRIEKEDYNSTKNWLPAIWSQIKELKKVFYDTIEKKVLDKSELDCMGVEQHGNRFVELEIKYSFCNDMKMNLIVLGLKAANSNWPCMHCTVNKNNLNERGKFL